MAADGHFTSTGPTYGTDVVQTAFDELKENMQFTERGFFMLAFFFTAGHYSDFAYTDPTYTDRLQTITVKNSGGTTIGSCALNYNTPASPYQLDQEVWVINGKTLTYDYTYTSGKLTRAKLTTIA